MARRPGSSFNEFAELKSKISSGEFSPVYVLMGDEPFYVDELVSMIVQRVVPEGMRDFNQNIFYGNEVDARDVIYTAMTYPVFAEKRLVVVREAQQLKKIEEFGPYFENPASFTVLVLAFTSASMDKRKSVYKKAQKSAVIFESDKVRDYEMPSWIKRYVSQAGYSIDDDAAHMLAEYCGNELRMVSKEISKLFQAISGKSSRITTGCVAGNTGVNREFSVFELTKALSFRDVQKAYRIAYYLAKDVKKNPMVLIIGALASYFVKVLKVDAAMAAGKTTDDDIAAAAGTFRSYAGEYRAAARNYPAGKAVSCISMLKDYDYKMKSGASGAAGDAELLMELVGRLMM